MWIFGHLGIGSKIAAPLGRRLPYRAILLGTILPDLVDKPLYYGLSLATGKYGAELGLISCTRTFGHTGIFVVGLTAIAWLKRSPLLAAIGLGVASHLVLDGFQDYWIHERMHIEGESSLRLAALFPFYEARFGVQPFPTLFDHLKSVGRPLLLLTEGIGLAILGWDYWKKKQWKPKRPLRIGLPWRRPRGDR